MKIDKCLDKLERRLRVEILIVAAGLTLQAGRKLISKIKEDIIAELNQRAVPESEMCAEAEKLFLDELLRQGLFPPERTTLVDAKFYGRGGRLNKEQSLCLWLGLFRQQTFGLAGLWQMYLDLGDTTAPLPPIIEGVFDPRGGNEENKHYINVCLFYMNASLLTNQLELNQAPQQTIGLGRLWEEATFNENQTLLMPEKEAKLLAPLLRCLQDAANRQKLDLTAEEISRLTTLLACLQNVGQPGLDLSRKETEELVGLLMRLRQPMTDEDTSKIIAWVIKTSPLLNAKDPAEVARELEGTKDSKNDTITRINTNLSRGHHTLMGEFVSRIYDEIDNYRGNEDE